MEEGTVHFETGLGGCRLSWNALGVARIRFPIAAGIDTGMPPPAIAEAIARVTAFLGGAPDDFHDIAVDLSAVPDFDRRVLEFARAIPIGGTASYGEIAEHLGDKLAAREVGQALGHNPIPIIVPCHRVLAAGGKIGGFSAPGGIATKRRLLALESRMVVLTDRSPQYRLL